MKRAWLSIAIAAVIAWTAGSRADAPASSSRTETVDPAYIVSLQPRDLVALDPDHDRFDLDVIRRTPASSVRAYHLSFTIASGREALTSRSRVVAATGAGNTAIQETGVVPVWPTIRRGRLAGVVRSWEYTGFDVAAELRENDADGRVIYRLRESNVALGISRVGLFARTWFRVLIFSLAFALLAVVRNGVSAGKRWRHVLAFDVVTLALACLAAAAFTYWIILAIVPCSLALVIVPAPLKARIAATTRHLRAAGGRWATDLASWSPAFLTVALTAWLLAWHYSLVLVLGFSATDFRDYLRLLAGVYFPVALAFSLVLHFTICRRAAAGRATGRVVAIAAVLLAVSGVMRVVDWSTFYYSAGHVDEDFWASAFYRQNIGIVSARAASWPVITLIAVAVPFAWLLRQATAFARAHASREDRPERRIRARFGPVLRVNALVAFVIVAVVHLAWVSFGHAEPRVIADNVRQAFSGVPELKFLQPLVSHAIERTPERPPLDSAFLSKLRHAGVRLGSIDAAYPLMKPSLYVDPRRDDVARPVVAGRTNLIVILCESLSSALLDESVHGVQELTPNFLDFARHAYSFRNLYSADFPTIKGQIATLASFAFDHRGLPTTAAEGNPLKSHYLFLSDVLKQRLGYQTLHVQSDFGRFADTTEIFSGHHYDRIRSADDADMVAQARHPLVKTWGLFDEDLFAVIGRMLETREVRQPFFMTVATTDMHFPYANLRHHPGTNGSELLDSVYGEDQAFGAFWNYFKGSTWATNTMVLVTADHALVRRAIRKGGADPKLSEFDYVAGMLYVPGGDRRWIGTGTDVLCTQLDLAPTLLDVLNADVPNPFLGLSIFSERPRYPLAIARSVTTDRLSAPDKAAVDAIGWTDADQQRYLALLRYLAVADRIVPPKSR